MVMVCFGAGMTTRAFFQNSGSVGRASGPPSMARRSWRSLRERRRFQSVPFLTEVFPVRFSFMSFRLPCRNDPTLSPGHIGEDHRDLNALYDANGIHANLAVLKEIVHPLKRGAFKDLHGVLERDAVAGNVTSILLRVPSAAHGTIFTLCISDRAGRKGAFSLAGPRSFGVCDCHFRDLARSNSSDAREARATRIRLQGAGSGFLFPAALILRFASSALS